MIKLMKILVLFLCMSGINHTINAAQPLVHVDGEFPPLRITLDDDSLAKLNEVVKNIRANGALSVDVNVSYKTVASIIGGFILAKSLYEGLWPKDDPNSLTMKELLKNAETNKQEDSEPKSKSISELFHENRNLIGGIAGCLLLLNKQILGLLGL